MEITTNEREAWIPVAERESASESRSLQSHRSRESLFECDEEPFQLWLRRIVPDPSRPTIDGEPIDSNPSGTRESGDIYWRADMPHAVVSRSPVDQTGDCTEPLLRTDQRSLFGSCTRCRWLAMRDLKNRGQKIASQNRPMVGKRRVAMMKRSRRGKTRCASFNSLSITNRNG